MTVTYATFIADFPEFKDSAVYSRTLIQHWLTVAGALLNSPPWDNTHDAIDEAAALTSLTWAAGVVTGVTASPHNLPVNTSALLQIGGEVPGAYNGVFACAITGPSGFTYLLKTDPGAQTTAGTYQPVASSILDVGTELFAAHWIVLAKRAADTTKAGGTPGQSVGMVSSKGLGPASIGYNTEAVLEKDAGHWNLTLYGTQLMHFVNMMGAGPIQVGVGAPPCGYFNGPAWIGPWPFPSITGFGG